MDEDFLEDVKTGIDMVDSEHSVLFDLADQLMGVLEADRVDRGLALAKLDALYDYAVQHFEHEETIMRNIQYPELFTHKAQHTQLLEEFATIKETVNDNDDVDVWKGMTTILRHWVQRHVQTSDVYLSHYIHAGLKDD